MRAGIVLGFLGWGVGLVGGSVPLLPGILRWWVRDRSVLPMARFPMTRR